MRLLVTDQPAPKEIGELRCEDDVPTTDGEAPTAEGEVPTTANCEVRPNFFLTVPGETKVFELREKIAAERGSDRSSFGYFMNAEEDNITDDSHIAIQDLTVPANGLLMVTVRRGAATLPTRDVVWIPAKQQPTDNDTPIAFVKHTLRCWACKASITCKAEADGCLELACGHTHCSTCADAIWSSASPTAEPAAPTAEPVAPATVECAFCRMKTRMTGLSRGCKMWEDSESLHKCSVKDCRNKATFRCECEAIFCANHETHRASIEHSVEALNADLTAVCSRHQGRKCRLSLYCAMCDENFCVDCTACNHIRHRHPIGSDAARQSQDENRQRRLHDSNEESQAATDEVADECVKTFCDELPAMARAESEFVLGYREKPPKVRICVSDALHSKEALPSDKMGLRLWLIEVSGHQLGPSLNRRAHKAVRRGLYGTLQLLFQRGLNADEKDENGATLLHIAAKLGDTAVAKMLFRSNADVNAQDLDGATPVHLAAEAGQTEMVRLLHAHGANVFTVNAQGATPSLVAAEVGHAALVELLCDIHLSHNANIHAENRNGVTPFLAACRKGKVDVIRVFIRLNVNVNTPNSKGETPMYAACENGFVAAAQLLHENGADVNIPHSNGDTPFLAACKNGHREVAQLLAVLGADVNKPNADGATPSAVAAQRGHTAVEELIKSLGADSKESANVESKRINRVLVVFVLVLAFFVTLYASMTPILFVSSDGVYTTAVRMLSYLVADSSVRSHDEITPPLLAEKNEDATVGGDSDATIATVPVREVIDPVPPAADGGVDGTPTP